VVRRRTLEYSGVLDSLTPRSYSQKFLVQCVSSLQLQKLNMSMSKSSKSKYASMELASANLLKHFSVLLLLATRKVIRRGVSREVQYRQHAFKIKFLGKTCAHINMA